MSTEDDKKATATVRSVLKDKSIGKIKFTVDKWTVTPALYQDVDKAIGAGKITVVVEPKILGHGVNGLYFPELKIDKDNIWYDVILLSAADLGTTKGAMVTAMGLIVHECTHAGMDAQKLKKMTELDHETIAYIAEATFQVTAMLDMGGDPKKVTHTQAIRKVAWEIGQLIVDKKPITKKLLTDLRAEIPKEEKYKEAAKKNITNDGVGRKWLINGRPT